MGKRFWVVLLLASCVGSAIAANPAAVRKQVESSLLVTGTIDINADGSVAAYALQRETELTNGMLGMIDRVIPQWRFEPIRLASGAASARATMNLRLVAKKLDDGNFSIEIRGAQFDNARPGESVSAKGRLALPRFPEPAARDGVSGIVYTLLKIGRDGRVEDAVAEQVNLRMVADEKTMQRWRDLLAEAALRAAKQWKFMPPTTGDEIDAPHWSARVPVDFIAPGFEQPDEHAWQVYVPGPRADIPWRTDKPDAGADALTAGGVYPLDAGPRLLTALSPS